MAARTGEQAVFEKEICRTDHRGGRDHEQKIYQERQLAAPVFSGRLSGLSFGSRCPQPRRLARGSEREGHWKIFGRLQTMEKEAANHKCADGRATIGGRKRIR